MRSLLSIAIAAAACLAATSCRGATEDAVAVPEGAGVAQVGAVPREVPPLDARLVGRVDAALDDLAAASVDRIQRLAPVFLGELEGSRLPEPLKQALLTISSVAPEHRSMHIARALGSRQLRPVWTKRLCEGDLGLLDTLGAMAPEVQTQQVVARCRLSQVGLVSREEALAGRALDLLLAHAAWVFLEPAGPIAPVERRLLRAIALGDAKASPVAGAP